MRRHGLVAVLLAALAVSSLAQAQDARMVVLKDRDITGHVFKRLGLPNQDYCWQQCLQESRCTGVRWGVIAGATAGQCQLLSGELTYSEPKAITTGDGQEIVVTASRKEPSPASAE